MTPKTKPKRKDDRAIVRISREARKKLAELAKKERRTIIATVDLLLGL
jgi:hypothetical protein